jgi:hypothetical protein
MRTCIFNGLEIGPWAAFPSAFRARRKGHEQRNEQPHAIEERLRPRAQGEDANQSRTDLYWLRCCAVKEKGTFENQQPYW